MLGQDQDAVGGSFSAAQNFIGELANLNIWDHVLTDQEITDMSQSCLKGVGNVVPWADFKAHLRGNVEIIPPSC